MLKWFRKQKNAPETVPAQIHPSPKLPAQTVSITESIVEEPATRGPEEAPEDAPAVETPQAEKKPSPFHKLPPAAPKPDAAGQPPESADDASRDDDPILLPEEELAAANAHEITAKPADEGSQKASLRAVQALTPKSGELMNNPKLLYRKLLAGMYDAIVITDPKGHVIETNARVRDLFLANADSLWDAPVAKLIHGITPQLLARLQSNIDKNRHVLLDATCLRADGTTFSAEVAISGIALINEGDFVFMIRNVDRRHQTLVRMRSYQNALEMSPCPTCLTDDAGKMTYGNPSLAAFLGLGAEDLPGVDLTASFADGDAVSRIETSLAESGKWEGTATMKTGEGKTAEAYVSVLPNILPKGKRSGFLVYIQPM